MGVTTIEWTDRSINPFRARNKETGRCGHFCVKISGGCKICYSSRLQVRFGTFPFVAENREKVALFLDESKLQEVLRRKIPTKWFWNDMTDMFLEDYLDDWIDQCFAVMALTPWHTHQVLTKRAERLFGYFTAHYGMGARRRVQDVLDPSGTAPQGAAWDLFDRWPLPNVWLGVSIEDQKNKNRIDILRQTPAAIRFLSIEPLLEDIGKLDLTGIDWVIVGGESGPGARPMHPDWARSVRDQCQAAGVAFFFKQWGGVRKKDAGALLDGREWREFPRAEALA